MPRRRTRDKKARPRRRVGPRLEWIGGRLSPPFFVEDRDQPYRAELVAWIEQPSGLVVGQEALDPEPVAGAVGRVLREALERPLAGVPRTPDVIRVADPSLVGEVRAVVGGAVPVTVSPTPELDRLLEVLVEWGHDDDEEDEDDSYLRGGRISPAAVEDLFAAARILHVAAPWEVATDDQVLRMDIPALGVEGACVCIIGSLGESLGLIVFPSLAGYDAFQQFAANLPTGGVGGPAPALAAEDSPYIGGAVDLGSGWLALQFERGADLPATMRREVAEHGWLLDGEDAYPRVERRDRDGVPHPLVQRDLKIAAACARSLSSFFFMHGDLFEFELGEPVCESYFDEDDLEVRLTLPYEAFPWFEIEAAPTLEGSPRGPSEGGRRSGGKRQRAKVGRNDPCPCGSGRKYKKCHLRLDEQQRATVHEAASELDDAVGPGTRPGRDPVGELEGRLIPLLAEFVGERFTAEWYRFDAEFGEEDVAQIAVPWFLYDWQIEGATVPEWYLRQQGQRFSPTEREWLAAQEAAWMSVWEVTAVDPGSSLTLRDLLSDETRCVREATASRALVVRDAVLARVVDHGGVPLLCGMHPVALPPIEAAEVVRRARGRLRRKRSVPVERLHDPALGRYLIRRWEEAVAELDASVVLDERFATLPELHNTDGDPFLLTTEHFDVEAGSRSDLEAALAAMEGVEGPEPGSGPREYVFLRPDGAPDTSSSSTVIGHARVSDTTLKLETNSQRRADALRDRVESACGDLIRYRAREHSDPFSSRAAPLSGGPAPEDASAEAQALMLELKQRHYADWVDQPLPALGGETPREAVRTARGRSAVDVLLKDMERFERMAADAGTAFDFSKIRDQLGLE